MKFLSKLKGSLKRGFTVLCATVMVLTSGILTGTEFQASAAKLNGSVYLSDALYRLSGNKYKETKEQWQAFLTEYSTGGQENYYLGTPYNSSLYAASPKGNQWQGYSGMNCQGFVWYIISHGLAYYNKVPVSTTAHMSRTLQSLTKWVIPTSAGTAAVGTPLSRRTICTITNSVTKTKC